MLRTFVTAILGLMLGISLCQEALASYAIPDEDVGTGVVQTVNNVTRSVTIGGHVYQISPKATYISDGGGEMRSLQPGMRVRFIANGPVKDPASRITHIVILPPTSP